MLIKSFKFALFVILAPFYLILTLFMHLTYEWWQDLV